MTHHLVKTGYNELVERLNRFPQGAAPSETLYKILAILFSEKDAALVARLPIKPFRAEKAAAVWKVQQAEAEKILNDLASRALLLDMEETDGSMTYVLPPPMAGFFEFSLMRLRDDIDQKVLSELFHQYLDVEEDFVRDLFGSGVTPFGRTFVSEPALSDELSLCVLDYERASEVIRSATHRGISLCYCRHVKRHLGTHCDAPLEICMTFNGAAESLIRHGHARAVDVPECLDLLQVAYDCNLVQFGSNVRKRVSFICNCCGCCCEAMSAARRFGFLHPVETTNFLPVLKSDPACTGCGKCVAVCPVEAMTLVSANDSRKPNRKTARLREDACLGCGLCVRSCPEKRIALQSRPMRRITPRNSVQLAVSMAIEKGKLQNLIFDNAALLSHRAMGAVLGAILALPPVKRRMAARQLKSQYVEAVTTRRQGLE